MSAYAGQFLRKRDEPPQTNDGRDLILADLKKLHRMGPSKPAPLAKRQSLHVDLDATLRKMAMTDADREKASFADEALVAVRKALALPPQSVNAQWTDATADDGAVLDGGYDAENPSAKPPALLPNTKPHRASISTPSSLPEDSDVVAALKHDLAPGRARRLL